MEIKELTKYAVHLPLPWLAGTIIALLFNAGIMYQQFSDLRREATEVSQTARSTADHLIIIDNRLIIMEERSNFNSTRIDDHDRRMRRLEGEHSSVWPRRESDPAPAPRSEFSRREHGQ